MRPRARQLLLITALVAGLALLGLPRNDFFEFCTTKAYGFPLPWWVDWCSCVKGGNWRAQISYWSGNVVLAIGVALLVHWIRRRGRRRNLNHGSG